jgi:hypothetical protein
MPVDKEIFIGYFQKALLSLDSIFAGLVKVGKIQANTTDSVALKMFEKTNATLEVQQKIKQAAQGNTELEALKKLLESDDKKDEKIGAIRGMIGKEILVQKFNGVKTDSIYKKIKSISIEISDAVIGKRQLFVTMEDSSVYFNKRAPVNFPKFFERMDDLLALYNGRLPYENIRLGDALVYHPKGRFNYPVDQPIFLDENKKEDSLKAGVNLDRYLDMAIYSDLLGLFGRKANGLIQTEIAGFFKSNSGNLKNTDIVFHSFVRPYIKLAKFDSRFSSLDSSSIKSGRNGEFDTLNRTYINQIAYFTGGLKMNIVRMGIGINQALLLNAGAEISLTATDSLQKATNSKYNDDIISVGYYPEIVYRINQNRNFGMDCSLKFMYQVVTERANIANKGGIWNFLPQIDIYYNPFEKENNRVYLRFMYFNNLKDPTSNFAQFQFGYRTQLMFNKKPT